MVQGNGLWSVWGIDLSDTAARSYAAGQFDEDGTVRVTVGNAILRVTVGAKPGQVPVLGQLHARYFDGCALLTGIQAAMYLEYIVPFVTCKKVQVNYALQQRASRMYAETAYKKMIKNSAAGMPPKTC